jgi:hypothetical protein
LTIDTPKILLLFIGGGATLKLADFYGEKNLASLSYIFSIISAFFLGFLISESTYTSAIILGTIIGVTLSGKVDKFNLAVGLITTVATAFIFGFKLPTLHLLIPFSIASLIDEIGHERDFNRNIFVKNFFRLRFSLKTVAILSTLLQILPITYSSGLICFDLSYDLIGWLIEKRV